MGDAEMIRTSGIKNACLIKTRIFLEFLEYKHGFSFDDPVTNFLNLN